MSSEPEPRGDGTDGVYRQSVLSTFDSCPLQTRFRLEQPDFETAAQASGQLFHLMAAEALRAMRTQGEDMIGAEDALAILHEQATVPGAPHVPVAWMRRVRIATIKWANENRWSTRNLVDVEHRLYAPLYLPDGRVLTLTGRPDAVLAAPPEGAVVIDHKLTWAVPPPSAVSERGFYQQRFYGYLLLRSYPGLATITLREMYPLVGEVREATISRGSLEEIEAELLAATLGLEAARSSGVWKPQPGKHCTYCPRPAECPLDDEERGEGGVGTEGTAKRWAAEWVIADAVKDRRTRALKAWVGEHGPIEVRSEKGRAVMGWKVNRDLAGHSSRRSFGLHAVDADTEIEGIG